MSGPVNNNDAVWDPTSPPDLSITLNDQSSLSDASPGQPYSLRFNIDSSSITSDSDVVGGSASPQASGNNNLHHYNTGGTLTPSPTPIIGDPSINLCDQDVGGNVINAQGSSKSGATLGHSFVKKNLHKPITCQHCAELLWSLLGTTGLVCEICNFLIHEKCLRYVVSPCTTLAPFLVNEPVAHCLSEPGHFKRKFCNVCRKRLDDTLAVRCEICSYYAHYDCIDSIIKNCKHCAIATPNMTLDKVIPRHHWREGNLPVYSKCAVCRKSCFSTECLTGIRCEWCGTTAHYGCYRQVPMDCTYGALRDIMLPPTAVSVPRTSVILEHIIGMQMPKTEHVLVRTMSEEFSSSGDSREEPSGFERKSFKEKSSDKDYDDFIRVYDGNLRIRKRQFRYLSVGKGATVLKVIEQILKTFHLPPDEAKEYDLVEINEKDSTERRLDDTMAFRRQLKFENRRPHICLRLKERDSERHTISVYPGALNQYGDANAKSIQANVTQDTTANDVLLSALKRFGIDGMDPTTFVLVHTSLDRESTERPLSPDDQILVLLNRIALESVRSLRLSRFYLRLSHDSTTGPAAVKLYVGNLKKGLNQRLYERILMEKLAGQYKWDTIDVIYYDFGSLVLLYSDPEKADNAYKILKESTFEDRKLLVVILPSIMDSMIPENVQPLLVFVNVKSGGCQGIELITSFRKLLNPHQVFNLDCGGPLPGLHCFNYLDKFKIMVCGGDGTVGWALSCLDNVAQDAACPEPPIAIVPLGTGNDLARVLRWGPGYTGGEDPMTLLRDVVEAENIRLDRWTVVIKPDQAETDEGKRALQLEAHSANTNEEGSKILLMNNYFGIGIDADLNLDFHNAREENPAKFNSRIHNKGVYFKMGLRKMVNRTKCKDLHNHIVVEVDGKAIDLPPLEGVIILNIMSWGAGANPWGVEKEDQFAKPTHYDGMLEVVGVSGVVHMGQIFSSLRTGNRLAQGGHIRITLKTEIPVQVDGEPWVQPPGQIIVLKSALKATMLKKRKKNKVNRRNTEPGISGNDDPPGPGLASGGPTSWSMKVNKSSASGYSGDNVLDNLPDDEEDESTVGESSR